MPIDQSFPFKKALEKDGMSYILEVKRHSPSKRTKLFPTF